MLISIKNWKLAILALIFFILFICLGLWQLSRATEKKALLKSFTERTQKPPLTALELPKISDLRFYRVVLHGKFDEAHTILLDNKIYHGKIGYQVYTPFKANNLPMAILVDRGFVPIYQDRNTLPAIETPQETTTIMGMLNLPPRFAALGTMQDSQQPTWPLRVEFIDLYEISQVLTYPVYPYILSLSPKHPAAYEMEWQIVIMPPERHIAYAIQWFALALTLLILFVALNRGRSS